MAKKINTENNFNQQYNKLHELVNAIEADETPLEKLPELIKQANEILKELENKLHKIESEINIINK